MIRLTEKDKEHFIQVCESSVSMADACRKLNLHFNTFKKLAVGLGCYNPNQSHTGIKLGPRGTSIKTQDILDGKYPNYQTFKLKVRLIREGIIEDRCCICGWDMKRDGDEFSPCELHHLDGNNHNHSLNNLQLLCPNCHSLTNNYRALNAKNKCSI